jgi:hypothetical protein
MLTIADYKQAMRDAICTVCVGFTPDERVPKRCIYESSGECTLFTHLDKVVDVASKVKSGNIEPYVLALREQVCANCSHQNEKGICNLRDSRLPVPTWCVLDSYFNLIVGVIEDLQGKAARESNRN